ncbi:MAG TPA: hypothetical protein VHF50_08070 [Solirubrobacterales bacterium]|nr:hypothetical protein [Solirubrobacterales bacterium]
MEAMRQSWTDERLDDFRAETARRFDEVDRRLHGVELGLRDLNHRIDGLQRSLVHGAIAMTSAILVGFGGMAGLIAAQF